MKKTIRHSAKASQGKSAFIELIKTSQAGLQAKKVTAGFDGFVDSIVKLVKDKPVNKPPAFFPTKKSFANYILEKTNSSFSLELEEIQLKLGGNMPIMANALGMLGLPVNCIGALGYPRLHPVFNAMHPNCKLHSFTEPGVSSAVEFDDGKIILGEMKALNNAGWQIIKERIGLKKLTRFYRQSDLLCMVNWAEIDSSPEIWRGILTDIMPAYKKKHNKQLSFFDLSDCSKRSKALIKVVLDHLKKFAAFTQVILGLNQNEARIIYQVLYGKAAAGDLAHTGAQIFKRLSIDTLVLHSSKEAIAFDKHGMCRSKSFFMKQPKISTGAGDNFNAGFCAARLMNFNNESALIFANAVAAIYMSNGASPQMQDVIDFFQTKNK